MNKHIALVKKWLANPDSVTVYELKANAASASAYAAAYADAVAVVAAAYADAYAAVAAADAYTDAAAAGYYVMKYEELMDECADE